MSHVKKPYVPTGGRYTIIEAEPAGLARKLANSASKSGTYRLINPLLQAKQATIAQDYRPYVETAADLTTTEQAINHFLDTRDFKISNQKYVIEFLVPRSITQGVHPDDEFSITRSGQVTPEFLQPSEQSSSFFKPLSLDPMFQQMSINPQQQASVNKDEIIGKALIAYKALKPALKDMDVDDFIEALINYSRSSDAAQRATYQTIIDQILNKNPGKFTRDELEAFINQHHRISSRFYSDPTIGQTIIKKQQNTNVNKR